MDLKDFIKETIGGIVEATLELQTQLQAQGVLINPPVSERQRDLYEHENSDHRFRRVEIIEFDVAVTAASETAGGGKAGLKIFSAEIGADGSHSRNHEQVSRVKFSVPIVLSRTIVEEANHAKAVEASEQQRREMALSLHRNAPSSWMR